MAATFWTSFENLFLLAQWVICVVMLIYIPQRKNPSSARTWLLLIFLVPWLGLLLYILLGRAYMPRKRVKIQRKALDRKRRAQAQLPREQTDLPIPPDGVRHVMSLVEALGEFEVVKGNHVELLPKYDESISRLITDIDAAKHHVHLLYYIFADDTTGKNVGEALRRAVKRGVQCRVLMDSIGSRPGLKTLAPRLRAEGVQVLEMLPVGLLRSKTVRFDLRNHRKIAVIDGRVAHVGSQNIVDADSRKRITYEDLVMRLEGPIVSQLQVVFLADWYLESETPISGPHLWPDHDDPGEVLAQALPSGPGYGRTNIQMVMVTLLHGALKRVVITTPYFVPDVPLLQAMETAVMRGVEVHLILSMERDGLVVGTAQKSYYAPLLEAGVHIHLYRPRFLHAKHMTVDDSVAIVGSSNVDIRSFALNSEISVLLYDVHVVAALRRIQEKCISRSKHLTAREWDRRGAVRKALQSIARLADSIL